MAMSGEKNCFIIMPFAKTTEEHTEDYWSNHFEEFLKPLVEEFPQIKAHRSTPLNSDIIKDIVKDLIVSDLVVADLTDLNPNVFWELGVRQSFKNGTITIAQEGTRLPFDIFSKGTLFYYPSNHIKNSKFTNDFRKAVTKCLDFCNSDSNVLEAISGRGTLVEIIHSAENIRKVEGLLEELSYNTEILKEIKSHVLKNKGKATNERFMITNRLSSACTELLLTTRYIDEGNAFYEAVAGYFTGVHQLNDSLRAWLNNEEKIDSWFEKCLEYYENGSKDFTADIQNIKRRLDELV